jgi:hypothetical protein
MQELLQLFFTVIGVMVVVLCAIGSIIAYFNRKSSEAFELTMVKMHYYDALGCKIDGGYTFMVKGSHKDFEKQVQTYIDKRFKPNTKIYWEILSVEDK